MAPLRWNDHNRDPMDSVPASRRTQSLREKENLMEFLVGLVFLAMLVVIMFEDEIRDLLSAWIDEVRGNTTKIYTGPDYNWRTETKYRKIVDPDNGPTYARKQDNGPWEEMTPEEWDQESKQFETFHHWRDEYADERRQRGEPERQYGSGDHGGPM